MLTRDIWWKTERPGMNAYASKDISHLQFSAETDSAHQFVQSFEGEKVGEYLIYRGRIR